MKAWRRLTGERLQKPLYQSVEEVIIRERKLHRIKVCIGTDSQVKGDVVRICNGHRLLKRRTWRLYFPKQLQNRNSL